MAASDHTESAADRESLAVPEGLAEHVERVTARAEGTTDADAVARTAQRLVRIGTGTVSADDAPRIRGPLRGPRPFARPAFDAGKRVQLPVALDDRDRTTLTETFGAPVADAAPRAVRRGVLLVGAELSDGLPDAVGPLGFRRPLARIDPPTDVAGERAEAALDELRLFIRGRTVIWGPPGADGPGRSPPHGEAAGADANADHDADGCTN